MDKTLMVLAAGMGSRFGGIKQIATLGPYEQTLLDFTIMDAIRAGFTRIVHIVRKDIYEDYVSLVAGKYADTLHTTFVYQEVPDYRSKPRGVAEAVSLATPHIGSVCAIVNADDYYGSQAMQQMSILLEVCTSSVFGMIGYVLGNTLSENGGVNRGICEVDEHGNLKSIVETKGIVTQNDVLIDKQGKIIDPKAVVSMNFWAFHKDTLQHLPNYVASFQEANKNNSDAELPLPPFADYLIHNKNCACRVVSAHDHRVGITYKEDIVAVEAYLNDSGKFEGDIGG